ncbi:MAG: hypothetical protein JXR78_15230 [Victivallales bacterium]|nr:hypothetical protein [Victivallales bacterium]
MDKANSELIERLRKDNHRREVIKKVFATPDGAEALDIIKEVSLYGQQVYQPGTPECHTFFRAGCQQVAINIIEILNAPLVDVEAQIHKLKKQEGDYRP